MRPAPAPEALAGLVFNGVAFAADMAMFDFGPKTQKIVRHGRNKGATILVGSHALHVQCSWQLRRGPNILANSAGPLRPAAVEPAIGSQVASVAVDVTGNIVLRLGDYCLDVTTDDDDDEQWRLLTQEPDVEHLVWGGEFGAPQ